MFEGMERGSFRKGQKLSRYFNENTDDPYEAREIINGDKKIVPSWSNGVSIGNLIKGYHKKFLSALEEAKAAHTPTPTPEPPPVTADVTRVAYTTVPGQPLVIVVDGEVVYGKGEES
jgi:hypothetical protein